MLKKILLVFLACLFVFAGLKADAANETADEAKIKAVIKEAFITEQLAYATTVEHGGQAFQGKPAIDAFTELEIYINNKKGYLDHLKRFIDLKEGNEKLHFAKVKKRHFREFDFKSITIDGDTATVEVDNYVEVTTTIGSTQSIEFITDEKGNLIDKRINDTPEHDWVILGGYKHFISLERINSRWQIVWDDWGFLPGYGP